VCIDCRCENPMRARASPASGTYDAGSLRILRVDADDDAEEDEEPEDTEEDEDEEPEDTEEDEDDAPTINCGRCKMDSTGAVSADGALNAPKMSVGPVAPFKVTDA
jgi:hypothetical protein